MVRSPAIAARRTRNQRSLSRSQSRSTTALLRAGATSALINRASAATAATRAGCGRPQRVHCRARSIPAGSRRSAKAAQGAIADDLFHAGLAQRGADGAEGVAAADLGDRLDRGGLDEIGGVAVGEGGEGSSGGFVVAELAQGGHDGAAHLGVGHAQASDQGGAGGLGLKGAQRFGGGGGRRPRTGRTARRPGARGGWWDRRVCPGRRRRRRGR